jgi:acetyl esterase/lipase
MVYPWLQMFNLQLPSHQRYFGTGLLRTSLSKYLCWYMTGQNIISEQLEKAMMLNYHSSYFLNNKKNKELFNKFKSYTDVELIPEQYKKGRSYYDNYKVDDNFPDISTIDENELFSAVKNTKETDKVFDVEVSPGLVDDNELKNSPPTYIIACEFDQLKDENIIYAQRLKKANIPVEIAYYESCFHGCITFVEEFKISNDMVDGIIDYIKKNV